MNVSVPSSSNQFWGLSNIWGFVPRPPRNAAVATLDHNINQMFYQTTKHASQRCERAALATVDTTAYRLAQEIERFFDRDTDTIDRTQ